MKFKILFFLTLLASVMFGNQNLNKTKFIISHDDLIDQRAQEKMHDIAREVKEKLKINLYIDIKENNGINPELPRDERILMMKQLENHLISKVEKPYAILALAIDQRYANILLSDDIKDKIDKDDILDNYVIPLLASKDKNTLFAKTSAASFNGIAQIADSLAEDQNIKLESSIGSEGKTAGTIWRVFMYTLVVIGILLYTVVVLRERKYKRGQNER